MHPVLCKLGPLSIYSYGVMVALGFAIATLIMYRRAPKFGLDANLIVDYIMLVLVTGIAGGRLLYVLLNLRYYLANPLEIPNLSKGGLVWYGGFILALIASLWFVRARKLDFWAASDLVAPYIALAQALGRLGCFMNGCCYGKAVPAGSLFAVMFPHESVPRCPTQLYSAAALFAIFAVLRLWQDARRFTGEIFLGYCILYSGKRFFMEFLRGDNPAVMLGLTMSQVISVIMFAAAAALFITRWKQWKIKTSSE
jgi:phosphatidylglycerol---prolipoprotein diacylglyceryl transferase